MGRTIFVVQILLQPSNIPVTVEPPQALRSRAKASLFLKTSLSHTIRLVWGLEFYRSALVVPFPFSGLRSQLDLWIGKQRLMRTYFYCLWLDCEPSKSSAHPAAAEFFHQSLGVCIINTLQSVRSCVAELPLAKDFYYYVGQIIS